MKSGNLAYN